MKKNEFIYNEFQTKLLKALSPPENEFFGVYNFKDYVIIFDREPKTYLKHISVSRGIDKKMLDEDLAEIAVYFLGENYELATYPNFLDFSNNLDKKKEKVSVVHFYEIDSLSLN